MKYLDEYRDGDVARAIVRKIQDTVTRPWVLMEVCGGQTHSIVRHGIDRMLPPEVELVHGPGCPVCVTPLETIDRAHHIAARRDVIFASFGDMLRVPGSRTDLLRLRSEGSDVRVVYSPLDALEIARANPQKKVVFFAIGFETTAPANAMAVVQAKRLGVTNFSMLVSHVLVPPAISAILESPGNRVQAFLGPGHVCAIVGTQDYDDLAKRYSAPMVVTGFEPIDLLNGVAHAVKQLEEGRGELENAYTRTVPLDGNPRARAIVDEAFEVSDRKWRGIGMIPMSGLALRRSFAAHDAEQLFDVLGIETAESTLCISGQVLRGLKKPCDCPAFGRGCTPETPLGATMVSTEGACAAYYQYGRSLPVVA